MRSKGGVLTRAHPLNLGATLVAALLTSRLNLPAHWLAGVHLYRPAAASADAAASPSTTRPSGAARRKAARADVALGGAEAVGRVAAPPSTLRGSDFYADWELVVTGVVALAANVLVDGARAAAGATIDARASAVVAACTSFIAFLALLRSEIIQTAFLKARLWPPLAAAAGGGALAAAVMVHAPAWLLPPPPLDTVAAAFSRGLYAATEIQVGPSRVIAAFILAMPAALAAALLPTAAARTARAADLALHPPAWGDAWLGASPVAAAITRLALALPAVAVLAWCPLTASVWWDTPSPLAAAAALTATGAATVAAARTIVAGGAGSSLVIWYTRKHGWTRGGPGAPASSAAAAREGELIRLSTGLVNVFVVKRAVEAGGVGLLLASLGVLSVAAGHTGHETAGAAAAWLGGWCAAVWGLSLAWNLLLFRIGYLIDVPGRRTYAEA